MCFRPRLLAQVPTLSADNNKSHNYPPGVCLDFYQGTIELEFFFLDQGVVQINHGTTFAPYKCTGSFKEVFLFKKESKFFFLH